MTIATKLAKKRRSKTIIYRPYVQAFFFVLIAFISINHSLAEAGKGISWLSSASLHALCPFGGVVTLYQFFTSGTLVQKVHDSSLVLMVIGFVMAIIAGPIFCGWVCPMGTFQEWIGKLGKRIFGKRYNHMVPEKWDKRLRYLRYLVAIWVVYMTARSLSLVFANVDPYFALFNFWSSEVALGGLVVLGVTMLLSLVVERPWCKYACPYGAVLGISNLFRVFRIRRNAGLCKLDYACDRACPMNIPVSQLHVVSDHQCISCLECTTEASCPAAGVVEFTLGGK